MNPVVRVLLVGAGTWVGSLIVSFVMIVLTAAATEKLGAGRMSSVLLVLLAAIGVLFLGGIMFVHWMGKRILAGQGSPWIYTFIYSAGALITLVVIGLITLVLFNR